MRDTHDELQAKFLSNPENKAEYDKLEVEYKAIDKQLKNKLYDKIDDQLKLHDKAMKQLLINNFEAVLDKYILKLDNVYNLDGNLTLDVEWEDIDHWDKNPSTQTIAEGTYEMKLDSLPKKIKAWAYVRGYMSGFDIKYSDRTDQDFAEYFRAIAEYQHMIIDELLERNDWEFLKEREVTGD